MIASKGNARESACGMSQNNKSLFPSPASLEMDQFFPSFSPPLLHRLPLEAPLPTTLQSNLDSIQLAESNHAASLHELRSFGYSWLIPLGKLNTQEEDQESNFTDSPSPPPHSPGPLPEPLLPVMEERERERDVEMRREQEQERDLDDEIEEAEEDRVSRDTEAEQEVDLDAEIEEGDSAQEGEETEGNQNRRES